MITPIWFWTFSKAYTLIPRNFSVKLPCFIIFGFSVQKQQGCFAMRPVLWRDLYLGMPVNGLRPKLTGESSAHTAQFTACEDANNYCDLRAAVMSCQLQQQPEAGMMKMLYLHNHGLCLAVTYINSHRCFGSAILIIHCKLWWKQIIISAIKKPDTCRKVTNAKKFAQSKI